MINFNEDVLEFEGTLEQRNKWDYYNHNGTPVPRMTHILKSVSGNDNLILYAARLGISRYNSTSEANLKIGSLTHEKIENFLINGTDIDNIPIFMNTQYKNQIETSYNNFKNWYNRVTNNGYTITIISIEEIITCPWYGGTIDCIMNISKGDYSKNYIVDFKTSKRIYTEYLLQTIGYMISYNMKPDRKFDIDGIGIIRVDKDKPIAEDFFINTETDNDAIVELQNGFYNMINWYYYQLQIEHSSNILINQQRKDSIYG